MRAYFTFTKKEFLENLRTYKLLIMFAVFLVFGMLSPLTAKFMPQIMEAFMLSNMKIIMLETTALDSWTQFFKNVSQMGLFLLVIVFSGSLANEFSKGTLVNMLTKGLPRSVVILSKYTMSTLVWTVSLCICFGVTYGYTVYFWNSENVRHILFAVFCLWLFGLVLLAAVTLGGVLFQSSYGSILFTGSFVVILFLLNMVPKLQEYNPIALVSNNMLLLTGELKVADFTMAIGSSLTLMATFILLAMALFNKVKL